MHFSFKVPHFGALYLPIQAELVRAPIDNIVVFM
jgi:hypothetical protein